MPWNFPLQNPFEIVTSGQDLLHLSLAGSCGGIHRDLLKVGFAACAGWILRWDS